MARSLTLRVFALIGAVFLIAAAALYLATSTLVMSQYRRIEDRDASLNAQRAVDALDNRVDQLGAKISDWASWDDAYQFMSDHNAAFIKSNLDTLTLTGMGVNVMLFIDTKGSVVFSESAPTEGDDDAKIPDALLAAYAASGSLLARDSGGVHQGMLHDDDEPFMFASRPILPTSGSGPIRGTLVFATFLSNHETSELATLTHLDAGYFPLARSGLPSDVVAVRNDLAHGVQVRVLDDHTIASYLLVKDIHDQPLLITRVLLARTVFEEAGRTLMFYLIVVLGVLLVAILVSSWAIRQVVRRDQTIALKNEFFSMASHELRTPLAAIRGNSQLITSVYGPTNDERLCELSNDIHGSSVRLIQIVNDFLDAARLERGKLPLEPVAVHLKDPVDRVVQELAAMAKERQLYVRAQLPAQLPPVRADAGRVTQVIYNLVGNAMKFTDEGGVTVTAEAHRGEVVVRITDTGRGIDDTGKRALFKSFSQVHAADASAGTGLGLYISKLLVQRMGGRIWLDSSELGAGTTIAFSLPRDHS